MQELPVCSQCGQDEEFLVSESGEYICVCGHEFHTDPISPSSLDNNTTSSYQVAMNYVSPLLH